MHECEVPVDDKVPSLHTDETTKCLSHCIDGASLVEDKSSPSLMEVEDAHGPEGVCSAAVV